VAPMKSPVAGTIDNQRIKLKIIEYVALTMDAVKEGADWPSVELRIRSKFPLLPASALFPVRSQKQNID